MDQTSLHSSRPQDLVARPRTIPYPIYFVFPDHGKPEHAELLAGKVPPSPDEVPELFTSGPACFVLQTYLHLARRGHDVRLVKEMVPESICVVGFDDMSVRDFPYDSYIVVARCDRPRVWTCEHAVVQNPLGPLAPHEHYIPHWSQPGLVARDRSRGDRVERVGFFGEWNNLRQTFRSDEFAARLSAAGFTLSLGYRQWFDYGDIDVVLAARDQGPTWLSTKPASKLYNAWHAGCPALLGNEPAFRQLRRSELDYFEVASQDDVLNALDRLRDSPTLYRDMVENGFRRYEEFTVDRIASHWEEFLAGPVCLGYANRNQGLSRLTRPIRFIAGALRNRIERDRFRYKIVREVNVN
jgi:hypothetical protein